MRAEVGEIQFVEQQIGCLETRVVARHAASIDELALGRRVGDSVVAAGMAAPPRAGQTVPTVPREWLPK